MECAQINVVGGTGSAKPATVSFPGIYKATDPGILVNIYSMTPSSKYVIPGPAVFTCDGTTPGGGGSNPDPVTTTAPAKPTTTLVTSVKPTSTQPASCAAAQWQQCGGNNYSGCTSCTSPYTCKVINEYYSQCT